MSLVKDNIPTDAEISQFTLDRNAADQIQKLQSAEESVMKTIKELAEKMDKATKERKNYQETQFEMSRNYIQLVNRKSTIFDSQALSVLKEHLKRNEERIKNETELANEIQGLADAYKEYCENLKECGKAWTKLYKVEMDWYNAATDLRKAQDKYETEKLDKIEKTLPKLKGEVEKSFIEKNHRSAFVEKSMVRVNQMWNKVKNIIKNIAW